MVTATAATDRFCLAGWQRALGLCRRPGLPVRAPVCTLGQRSPSLGRMSSLQCLSSAFSASPNSVRMSFPTKWRVDALW